MYSRIEIAQNLIIKINSNTFLAYVLIISVECTTINKRLKH